MLRSVGLIFLVFLSLGSSAQYSFSDKSLITDLQILSSDQLEGRKAGSEGGKKAREIIVDKLKKLGLKPYPETSYDQPFSITQSFGQLNSGQASNILAVIDGRRKETIVLSAHYDHVGVMNKSIYNGADDNASGTAALLAFAEYFSKNKPEHRLVFAFFDAEEMGLKGSAHFVKSIDLKSEKIVLNINMDMISRSEKNELYVCGLYFYPNLRKPLEQVVTPNNFKLLFGHDDPSTGPDDWTRQSDQLNFHMNNIPFLYFGVEDHEDYHKPTDVFEKIDQQFYLNSVETILQSIILLDQNLDKAN